MPGLAALPIPIVATWLIAVVAIGGVLTRPRRTSEWMWALGGALALVVCGLVTLPHVLAAIARGTDVYLFLSGMMLLAALAEREGVFAWTSALAVRAARGSRWRLFTIVYGVGIAVTTVLSNDATAVVLTPAVAAAVRQAKAEPLPHLLACAFIANAASFVLPISNPANLVVFGNHIPALGAWLVAFALPSLAAIVTTFALLAFATRDDLRGDVTGAIDVPPLRTNGRVVLGGIGALVIALLVASARDASLGIATAIGGVAILAAVTLRDRSALTDVVRNVSWSVLLLVAGLFVLVQGVEQTGLLAFTGEGVRACAKLSPALGVLLAGGATALLSNAINNLPAGLIAAGSVASVHGHQVLRSAIAIGIDLGPNLSVTGSLATVLWLIALRRENIAVSAWTFLRVGMLVMPPALVLALESAAFTAR